MNSVGAELNLIAQLFCWYLSWPCPSCPRTDKVDTAPFSDGLRVLWTAQFFKEQMENCQVNGEVFCVLIIAHKMPLSVPKAGSHTVVTKLL